MHNISKVLIYNKKNKKKNKRVMNNYWMILQNKIYN